MFEPEERIRFLRSHGTHCMATSLFQPGMSFFDMPGVGFIGYRKKWGTAVALAEPVCDPASWEEIVRAFLAFSGNAVFLQVSRPFALMLHERFGYLATQCGIETIVHLERFDLKGRKKQVIRTAVNKANKDGVLFVEKDRPDPEVEGLTQTWIQTRRLEGKQLTILVRPLDGGFQEDVRHFYAYLGSRLIGAIQFDPLYRQGSICGYVPNVSRFDPAFKQGIFYALMVHAMQKFRDENIEYVNLGLSPFVLDPSGEEFESEIVRLIFRTLYRYGNRLYSYQGLDFTKQRFQGEEVKTYYVHRYRLPVTLLAFLCMDL
ncbi:MAG: DUF2156 domain-containing protein [Desulfomonilia bacterium]